jgi:energy-converting hydrogenase Eha subunit H
MPDSNPGLVALVEGLFIAVASWQEGVVPLLISLPRLSSLTLEKAGWSQPSILAECQSWDFNRGGHHYLKM